MVTSSVALASPHRLLFLIGVVQLAAVMFWWLTVLSGVHFGMAATADGNMPKALFHAPALIYLVLPPLFFGFLLTVFPRWMGYLDLQRLAYAPVAGGYALAALFWWSALLSGNDMLHIGAFAAALLASLWGIGALASVALRECRNGKGPTWHAWSILAAFAFGIAGQVAFLSFLLDPGGTSSPLANQLSLWTFILPVFFTVCHRMVPFFAGNAVAGYVAWRPYWLLAAFWPGTLLILAGLHLSIAPLGTLGSALLAALMSLMVWKWWPRTKAPALLWVLVIGFVWSPVGYALTALSSLGVPLGRAPEHALTIGFAGSLLIAMVTRVTQGHSGRPLVLPIVGWIAFAGVQAAAVARAIAAISDGSGPWLVLSAAIFFVALFPWATRSAAIYISPRIDDKPG